jgi:Carboxypeptidase regulatory-like domain
MKSRSLSPLMTMAPQRQTHQQHISQQKKNSGSPGFSRKVGLISAILCLSGMAFAQGTNSGDIRGTVTDSSGAVIPGAKVTILNVDTGIAKDYLTNNAGLYDTVSILPGRYRITFSKDGFGTLVREGITLDIGAPLTVDAQLSVGAATQSVQVTEESPLLKTETAEQSSDLKSDVINELPNVTRSWTNMTKMLPGVVGTGYSLAVNGTMPFYANFMADGAATTLPHSANVDLSNFEAISEVQINTSTFSAQYGTGAAVYNQISKSGSNQWHGSAYEFVQNNDLNARSYFSGAVPITKFNNFGGSVSGPIRKDKLFFYFNTEKIINNTLSYNYYTYPTADMLAGNFSNPIFPTIYEPNSLSNGSRTPFPNNTIPASMMDPLALAVQKYFPSPNLPSYANNLLIGLNSRSPWMKYIGRADYQISDRNRLTMSVTEMDNPNITPSPDCPIDCYTGDVDSYNAQVSDVWTVTPTFVNEFRIGYVREDDHYSPPQNLGQNYPEKLGWTYAEANMFPGVTIGGPVGATSIGTPGANVTAIYAENGIDPSDMVTWVRGKHILHFGAELMTFQDNDTPWGNINSGNFSFTGVYTGKTPLVSSGLGYADFLLGDVQSWSATNSPINAMRQLSPQLFVQDDIKLTPHFTLNLGVRYQIQGGWHELHNQLGDFDPTIMNPATNTLGAMWFAPNNGRNSVQAPVYDIVLPRAGFAWSPSSKLVIRGGFGAYAYGWSEDTYVAGAEGFGANSTGSLSDSTQVTPVFPFSSANPPLNYVGASKSPSAYNGQSVNFYPYHTPVARNYQWNVSVQRELPGGMMAEAAYVGNHANNLAFPGDINQVPYSELGTSSNPQSLRPYPQFLNINGSYYNALSNYDSMQLSIQKRFANGFTYQVNYTWSRMLSDQDSSGWSGNGGTQDYQNFYLPGVNYGLSNLNRSQMFKGSVVYDVPVGKGRRFLGNGGPLDYALGGWQVSTIFIIETGEPFTPTMAGADNSGAISGNWYPNVIGNVGLPNPSISEWFNTAAFAQPAANTFGDAGRNILIGPGMSDIDFSMAKSFTIPKLERGRLQLRIDSTNIINHPSFSNPNASIGSPAAGIITATTVGGRTVQLGARFSF